MKLMSFSIAYYSQHTAYVKNENIKAERTTLLKI
jgi:hypothetical protein